MPRPKKITVELEQIQTDGKQMVSPGIPVCIPVFETKEPAVVHYPFQPEIRAYEDSIQRELATQISAMAAFYGIPETDLSASISLTYTQNGWILGGEVVHTIHAKKEGN